MFTLALGRGLTRGRHWLTWLQRIVPTNEALLFLSPGAFTAHNARGYDWHSPNRTRRSIFGLKSLRATSRSCCPIDTRWQSNTSHSLYLEKQNQPLHREIQEFFASAESDGYRDVRSNYEQSVAGVAGKVRVKAGTHHEAE